MGRDVRDGRTAFVQCFQFVGGYLGFDGRTGGRASGCLDWVSNSGGLDGVAGKTCGRMSSGYALLDYMWALSAVPHRRCRTL